LADSRSLDSGFKRLLLRKQTLILNKSAAATDPEPPFGNFRTDCAENVVEQIIL
jgi:hypothetical protein